MQRSLVYLANYSIKQNVYKNQNS